MGLTPPPLSTHFGNWHVRSFPSPAYAVSARILQPQYAFINLNPFEVLQLHHTATDEDIKVRYRKVRVCVCVREVQCTLSV
jgi:hypothetical protein